MAFAYLEHESPAAICRAILVGTSTLAILEIGLAPWRLQQKGHSQAVVTTKLTRTEAYFSGQVQGVGFRYSTRRVAQDYQVTGIVKNLLGGRVQVVAEGTATESKRFVEAVESEMSQYVTHVERKASDATGEFQDFDIRY